MEYLIYRYYHGQHESSFMLLLARHMDVFSLVLDNEVETRRTVLVHVDKYSWRELQSWVSGPDYRGRRRDMVSALACTCKMLQNMVQQYMNPDKLTRLTRTILRSNSDYALWCLQRLELCGGTLEDPLDVSSDQLVRGRKRKREEIESSLLYLDCKVEDSDGYSSSTSLYSSDPDSE